MVRLLARKVGSRHRVAVCAAVVSLGLIGGAPAHSAIYGLIDTGEIYASSDGGGSWTILATLPVSDAVGLAAGSSPTQLFVVTRSGTVFKSANAGFNWSAIGTITASDVASFTIQYDASILALTESGTLYRSTDGGATFDGVAALTGADFVSLTRGPLGRLYALTRTGEVYETQNQGAAWTAVGAVPSSRTASIRRKAAELHILTETGEVYRSLDFGRSWIPIGSITANNMSAIVNVGTNLVAAARTGEIYVSSAGGTTWSAVGTINQVHVTALGEDTPLATGIQVEEASPPLVLRAPYPNPTIRAVGSRFELTTSGPDRVRFEVFDVAGRRVAGLGPRTYGTAGVHSFDWKPLGIPQGTYLVRLITQSGHTAVVKWSLVN